MRIPMFKKNRDRIPALGRIRSECQCSKKWGKNTSVRKDKIGMPMFKKIRAEFHCKEG